MSDPTNADSASMTICHIGAFHSTTRKTVTNADSLADRLTTVGVDSICASHRLSPLRRGFDMARTIIRNRGDYRVLLIHVYSGSAFLWATCSALLGRALGKRIVLWLHGGNLPVYSSRHPRLVARVLRTADRILAPSEYLASSFRDRYRVDILPYELTLASYPYRQRTATKPKLLWLRAFNHNYNPTLAPRVVALLAGDYSDVALTMCGPDNGDGSFQETQRVAEKLGVAGRIEFPGKVSKARIRELGQVHDLFINTTHVDNTPVSVVEALAMGMCVVSTNVGGMPYLLAHEREGLLVEPNDAEAMAGACRRILTDPQLAATLSGNGLKRASSFDWENIAPRWRALLQDLDHSGPRPLGAESSDLEGASERGR